MRARWRSVLAAFWCWGMLSTCAVSRRSCQDPAKSCQRSSDEQRTSIRADLAAQDPTRRAPNLDADEAWIE